MPAGKVPQSNAMLYTLITFVAPFVIATVFAVIFYVKAEDYKTQRDDIDREISGLASKSEQHNLSTIVGQVMRGKSYLGPMNEYLASMVSAITGDLSGNTTAAVKVNAAIIKINETIEALGQDVDSTYGPEGIDLLQTINQLKFKLDTSRNNARRMEEFKNKVQDDFDMAVSNFRFGEQQLIQEKNRYQAEANRINAGYEELKQLMAQSADEQIQAYMDKLDKTEQQLKEKNMELLKTQAALDKAAGSLKITLNKLESIKPRPDIEVEAFLPDAKIVSIDAQAQVVYLDIGRRDHVYRGLTFSVYDKNIPIPQDGKGKAEIELFDIRDNVSAMARILSSSKKTPIVPEDIVVNLIWDSKTSNKFIVVGDFDFDLDGKIDSDGGEKIEQLAERWGGRLVDKVTIETDFIVLGTEPEPMARPGRDQIDSDPMVEQRYEASLKRISEYKDILAQAQKLSVPIFNQKRFYHLIGYELLASKSSPF